MAQRARGDRAHICDGDAMSGAKRFGGRYSPDRRAAQSGASGESRLNDPHPFRGRRAKSVSLRALAMFLLPTPLLFAAFADISSGNAIGMGADLAAYASLILGAWLLRDGLEAERAYEARSSAKPPAFPRKTVAAGLAGLGVGIATYLGWGLGLIETVVFGAVAVGAHLAAFGLDPMKAKGLEGVSDAEATRVHEALAHAEALIAETHAAAETLRDRDLIHRIDRLCAAAREVLRAVEEDPRDLRRARKFISVYLKGARDAAVKYADAQEKGDDPAITQQFTLLMTDMEKSFTAQRERLLLDDRADLEVEIEVLRDRLKQDGV